MDNEQLIAPTKIIEPILIRDTNILNLCGYGVRCEEPDFSKAINNQGNTTYNLKEYLIVYNCIGWAFGIRDWIDPSTQKCDYDSNYNINCFKELTQNYIHLISTKYNAIDKRPFVQEDIVNKLNSTVFCFESMPNTTIVNKYGAVAFYFKNGFMTHASRFVSELEGHKVDSWTSKLGHGIMIAHQLEDLAGGKQSLYGDPLCYAVPTDQEQNSVSEFSGCLNKDLI